ncbi:MAG TPA: hypothetical protein PKW21_06565 [Rhabdaerophilum sp.]|nr:hypothetical protein [Rhabdaerophilum sp.]
MSHMSMVEPSLGYPAARLALIAILGGVFLTSGVLAGERENRFGRNLHPASSPMPMSRPECTCRAQGQSYHVGTETCLHINGISQIFRCDMDLNVTSWKPTGSLCPLS